MRNEYCGRRRLKNDKEPGRKMQKEERQEEFRSLEFLNDEKPEEVKKEVNKEVTKEKMLKLRIVHVRKTQTRN